MVCSEVLFNFLVLVVSGDQLPLSARDLERSTKTKLTLLLWLRPIFNFY